MIGLISVDLKKSSFIEPVFFLSCKTNNTYSHLYDNVSKTKNIGRPSRLEL